jgi:hypothetical protein
MLWVGQVKWKNRNISIDAFKKQTNKQRNKKHNRIKNKNVMWARLNSCSNKSWFGPDKSKETTD